MFISQRNKKKVKVSFEILGGNDRPLRPPPGSAPVILPSKHTSGQFTTAKLSLQGSKKKKKDKKGMVDVTTAVQRSYSQSDNRLLQGFKMFPAS